jgi:lipopolysaccharide transport system permease protein
MTDSARTEHRRDDVLGASPASEPKAIEDREEVCIEPGLSRRQYWRDIWKYRDLLYFLSWRDVAVRYKQTALGIAWALLRPGLTAAIFAFVFGRVAHLPSNGVPYILLVFTGLLPWQLFSGTLGECSNSLVNNSNLICKVYFPRLIVPLSTLGNSLIELLISLGIIGVLLGMYRFAPDWRMAFLPVFTLLALECSLGLGLWMAALNVKYRDFRYVVPFIVQCGLYISPVGFQSSIVPSKWKLLYALNPTVAIIDGFRWSLLRGRIELDWASLGLSFAVSTLLLMGGIRYFRQTERSFADVI